MSATEAADAPAAPPAPDATPRKRWRVRYAVVGAVLVGALVVLAVEGLGNSLDYYLTASQALQQKATLGSREFRIEGVVVPGSIRNTADGVDFQLSGGPTDIPVVASTTPPQLFQPDIPVVLDGHFAGNTFTASQILVKHTSQYIAQHPDRVTAPNGSVR